MLRHRRYRIHRPAIVAGPSAPAIRCSAWLARIRRPITRRGRCRGASGCARRSRQPETWSAASDGVIHTAFIHDFSNLRPPARRTGRDRDDRRALAGSGRPFVVPSGIGRPRSTAASVRRTMHPIPAPPLAPLAAERTALRWRRAACALGRAPAAVGAPRWRSRLRSDPHPDRARQGRPAYVGDGATDGLRSTGSTPPPLQAGAREGPAGARFTAWPTRACRPREIADGIRHVELPVD